MKTYSWITEDETQTDNFGIYTGKTRDVTKRISGWAYGSDHYNSIRGGLVDVIYEKDVLTKKSKVKDANLLASYHEQLNIEAVRRAASYLEAKGFNVKVINLNEAIGHARMEGFFSWVYEENGGVMVNFDLYETIIKNIKEASKLNKKNRNILKQNEIKEKKKSISRLTEEIISIEKTLKKLKKSLDK